jgi:hypothetical protein
MIISLKTLCMKPEVVLNELVKAVEVNKLNPDEVFVSLELKVTTPLLAKDDS